MRTSHSSEDHELLRRLSSGDEAAFTLLFERYRVKIYITACKFLRSQVLAEEIVQDVFLKVWLKRADMSTVVDIESYLFIMARNFVFERIKKTAYESAGQMVLARQQAYTDDADLLVIHHQHQQLLEEALALLPPQQREVYQLAKSEGLSHKMIAKRMRISPLTVKAHMAKALQSIRKYLNTHLCQIILLLLAAVAAGCPR